MFTGIIQDKLKIENLKKQNEILFMNFKLPKIKGLKFSLGDSVSLNGVCSTVAKISKKDFSVGFIKETLDKTTMKEKSLGDELNFENSLRVGDSLGGHFVHGHIDSMGEVNSVKDQGDSKVVKFSVPKSVLKFIIYKGSIAVNGVSLTVSKVLKDGFEVSLIPHTLHKTNLDKLRVGDRVNIETDALGKYVLESRKVKSKK